MIDCFYGEYYLNNFLHYSEKSIYLTDLLLEFYLFTIISLLVMWALFVSNCIRHRIFLFNIGYICIFSLIVFFITNIKLLQIEKMRNKYYNYIIYDNYTCF